MSSYRRAGPIELLEPLSGGQPAMERKTLGFRPLPLGEQHAFAPLDLPAPVARAAEPPAPPPAPPPPPPKPAPTKKDDGFLKVKVHAEGDTATIFGEVDVSVSGPTTATMTTKAVNGIADFGAVPPGSYTVQITKVPEKHAKQHVAPDAPVATSVAPKQQQLAFVPLPKVGLVTPKLEAEYPVALLDRQLDRHQAGGETPLKPTPTYLVLTLTQAGGPAYAGTGTLTAANVAAFRDEACTQPFDLAQPIPAAELTGGGLKLWLRGTNAGKTEFKLTLSAPTSPKLAVAPPATLEFGVVELQCRIHQHDVGAIAALKVDPDTDPVSKYHDDLVALALPDQVALSDAGQIADGRLLHVQKDAAFGRAKLIVKARVGAQWPAEAATVDIALASRGSGGLRLFDAEFDGSEVPLPLKIPAAQLSADRTYWVEGAAESDALRGTELSLGLDRAPGGLAHAAKHDGDVARCTVIRIATVAIEHTPDVGKAPIWDEPAKRWYINARPDPAARKIKVVATLGKPLAGIKLHFMLAPHRDNQKAANWGVDLPNAVPVVDPTTSTAGTLTWLWKDVPAALKVADRADRRDLLHLSSATDGNGKAVKELTLSRIGGDRFQPMAYAEQDPHLAKYIDGHATLGTRKPAACTHDIEVRRRFWAQRIAVAGVPSPSLAPAIGQYARIRTELELAPDIALTLVQAKAMVPPSIYPRHMIEVNGGNADALLVSDTNKGQFFANATVEADRPLKATMVICDAQWDDHPSGPTPAQSFNRLRAADFPLVVDVGGDRKLLTPPLQGGSIVVGGNWTAAEWDPAANAGAGGWTNVRTQAAVAAEFSIDPARDKLTKITANLPAGWAAAAVASTRFWLTNLQLNCAKSYLGECAGRPPRLIAVYDPAEAADFQNTVVHECGHAFGQAPVAGMPGGVPDHPETVDRGQGNHCRHDGDKCVMYDAGPIVGSYNRYCVVCHPYLLLTDFSKFS